MTFRYLLGPVSGDSAARFWAGPRRRGECLAFNAQGDADVTVGHADSWEQALARLPAGWRPDALVLYLGYSSVPAGMWSAPVPIVGAAPDWNMLWHGYRAVLPLCERVLTDAPGVALLRRCGWTHARAAVLYGPEPAYLGLPLDGPERDIDVLFVGNLHPAVQRERLRWLGRIARLPGRRVVIRSGAFDDAYRSLLRRSRIAFNRSIRGECNRRAFEAAACGALLFQEQGNAETLEYFRDRRECVCYGDDDLEAMLEHYLSRESERRAIAAAAHGRVQALGCEALWEEALSRLRAEWPAVQEASARRPRLEAKAALLAGAWQALSGVRPPDPALAADLETAAAAHPDSAALHHARGLVAGLGPGGVVTAALAEQAARAFRRALEYGPDNAASGLALAEAHALLGQKHLAVEGARRILLLLARGGGLGPEALDSGRFPPGFDYFRIEWERAAWLNAGRPEAERRAKADLLRWRLHALLAELTGDLSHYHEAALARPDLPPALAALGCALGRAARPAEAVPHLRRALAADPFDRAAARGLHQALRDIGDAEGARRLAVDRRLLHRAAPQPVPAESWFAPPPPAADDLASIIILCCNQVEYTRLCLDSVTARTRPPYELVVIDNGSTDATPAYLEELRSRPGPARVEVVRNDENRGFPAGCNQGLTKAQGRWVVFLNNDTAAPAGWLEGLIARAVQDPLVGMVGAVTNFSREPQQVVVDYKDISGLEAFAERRRREHAGRTLGVDRLTGFCLLARRDVLDEIGGFDERYGLGFFDDDDLSVKALRAGRRLVVALDVFIHHFGGRTFSALGVDSPRQLEENLARFRDKWGAAETAGYRLPTKAAAGAAPAGRRMRVSLCMIVRNEEENLPACLRSAADLVDEVVVVDTGSTDRTKEVAAQFGARVFDFPWVDDFAAARNETLRHATGDWVLWLDADDRLDEDNRGRLRTLFAGLKDENAAYVMKCLCLPDKATGMATLVDHLRLFRNRPDVRWTYRIHEQLLPAVRKSGGEVRWSDVTVHHTGYQDPDLRARKVQRDLRLLKLEDADRPDDPFTLFNLGSAYHELGKPAEALPRLLRSLEKSHPHDSIVRKLYSLIAGCHRQQGRPDEALAICRDGRRIYPDDPELLLAESMLLRDRGDLAGAEACVLRVFDAKPGPHFASVDAGLCGYKARHQLAVIYHQQGRAADAEAQWRLAVAEKPSFAPGWLGLGESALKRGDPALLEEAAQRLESLSPNGPLEAALLHGRWLLARREFAAARAALEAAVARFPHDLGPRLLMTHVLLQEGKDLDAAEKALRDVLAMAPEHPEARRNLDILLRRRREERERPTAALTPSNSNGHTAAGAPTAGPVAALRVAVISTVHNEEVLIVPFLEHYLGLGADAVILLANDCTDRTLEFAARYPAVSVEGLDSGGELDCAVRRDALDARRCSLAGRFDWVLLVDADEFLVPKQGGLKETLRRYADRKVLGSEGWTVVQRPDDPSYDPAAPLLPQRRWGKPDPAYGKPIIVRPEAACRPVVGLHYLEGAEPRPPDVPFFLLHLSHFDEAVFLKRRLQMTARQGLHNIQSGYSIQHTARTEADLRREWRAVQEDPGLAPLPMHAQPENSRISV
ncbi:MAG TPA: glycosyltransferase [Gemmataceae bacterium]|nr:glycosyltransferase [Gemmataceae bacterium]